MKGRVSHWAVKSGYGFIKPETGIDEVFVHYSYITDGSEALLKGEEVEFDIQKTDKPRNMAVNVKRIGLTAQMERLINESSIKNP